MGLDVGRRMAYREFGITHGYGIPVDKRGGNHRD